MEQLNLNHSAPNLVSVCIDTNETGRMYHRYMEGPVVFHQYTELLLKMEELYDRLGYPQAGLEMRQFDAARGGAPVKVAMEPVVDTEKLTARRGDRATFLIHVKWRQMATWQGELLWLERNRKEFFESELDLLKILDAATRSLS